VLVEELPHFGHPGSLLVIELEVHAGDTIEKVFTRRANAEPRKFEPTCAGNVCAMSHDNSRYVISRSKDGEYYFVLTAENGQTLMTSETFSTKESAEVGIRTVRGTATAAKVVDAAE
jgi:uncharacterized protein YegP (UPF0339 family)